MAYIGRTPENGGFEKQILTADGSTTTYTLTYSVGSDASILVSVAGVFQQPGTAYTLSGSGTTLIFSTAPASGVTVFLIYLGLSYDAGTFLDSGVITSQTALTSVANGDQFLIYDTSAGALRKVEFQYVHVALAPVARAATGDGSTVGFTVTSGTTTLLCLVFLNGVCQVPTTDYAVSGTTLTFTTAPASGDAIQIREL